ncbi:MAG: beta-galactosidase [Clostridia bacterium]|nr:beta-galactosidase [Clostridia bacterium]
MERLTKIGRITPKSSKEIRYSRIGVGFEKLDRNLHDPEMAYDKLAECGVKWARIQSGWQRTEREKGVYDFGWIDSVVDNLTERGIEPWIDLCYGNELYSESAANYFGAVGVPPIFTEEEKQGWANYCKAIAERYKGKVTYYEVWNEPDGAWCWKHGPSGTEYGKFVIETSKAIRSGNPDAKMIGGSVCRVEAGFLADALEAGMGDYIDAITYHEYVSNEQRVPYRVRSLRGLLDLYNPNIKIIQGESGSQSKSDGHGALRRCAWTESKQAKQLLRHTMVDLESEVEFLSYFSAVDMIEGLNADASEAATVRDYGYFGILGADFDENGRAKNEYKYKPSFYALQNVCALFSEDVRVASLPIIMIPRVSERISATDDDNHNTTSICFKRDDGKWAYVYWKPTNILSCDYEGTVTIHFSALKDRPHLVDLMDGSVYEIPDSMIEPHPLGGYYIVNLPIKDYPMALTNFC